MVSLRFSVRQRKPNGDEAWIFSFLQAYPSVSTLLDGKHERNPRRQSPYLFQKQTMQQCSTVTSIIGPPTKDDSMNFVIFGSSMRDYEGITAPIETAGLCFIHRSITCKRSLTIVLSPSPYHLSNHNFIKKYFKLGKLDSFIYFQTCICVEKK